MPSHTHREGGKPCPLTRKACDERYAEWQADQQVWLAHRIVQKGDGPRFRKDTTVFGQLVQVMAGERQTITNADGVEAQSAFTQRVLRALDRWRAERQEAA